MSFRILPALLCLTPAAFAATYRCEVGGSVLMTDRPCAVSSPPPMGSSGPTRATTSYQAPTPSKEQAPEHHRYLSQRCAEVSEAIRTAAARGAGAATVNDLRREYSRDCSEEDSDARRMASDAKRKQRESQLALRTEAERSRRDAERLSEKCTALRDALRSHPVENETERLNKKAGEEAYNANCLGK